MLQLDDILTMEELYNDSFDITNEDLYLKDDEENNALNIRNLNLLIRCFNLVYSEISSDYIPLIYKETITVNGEFDLNNLSKKFYKIIKLEKNNKEILDFEIYSNTLFAKEGVYTITYRYTPEYATLNSNIENFNGKVLDRIFAYGLNKEYCYISGLYSEAESWKNKFEDSMKLILNKTSFSLPKRRWE